MTWRKRRDRHGKYVKWIERLSNGRVLTLMFSVNQFHGDHRDIAYIYPHLIVHRPFMRRHTWRYAGLPTGPGGTEVFGRVMELWNQGIEEALALTNRPRVDVEVSAETERLFKIYRGLLGKRGYVYHQYEDGAEVMYLTIRDRGFRLAV